jgi:hypothetical protein
MNALFKGIWEEIKPFRPSSHVIMKYSFIKKEILSFRYKYLYRNLWSKLIWTCASKFKSVR